jgi:addiction module HigA family antidote
MKSLRNPQRKPTHPGAVLREDVLPELGWTQIELASKMMVSRQTVSDLLHERKSVTAEMAIRIARTVGGTPESWLRMQEAIDLWVAEMKFKNNPALAPQTSGWSPHIVVMGSNRCFHLRLDPAPAGSTVAVKFLIASALVVASSWAVYHCFHDGKVF